MTAQSISTQGDSLAKGLAHHVMRWARECDAPEDTLPLLQLAARATSLATASGHVCAYITDIAAEENLNEDALRKALFASGMVGTPSSPDARPLILDDDGRLYLHRYFDYECRLARRLMQPSQKAEVSDGKSVSTILNDLFSRNAKRLGDRADWQKIATALALVSRLTIISGGPGTGKTTTVVNVLACALSENPNCRIALAAPTGKAAARMLDAIRNAAIHLTPELGERLPAESFTIHRLLGVKADSGEIHHNAGNLLPIDLLVVDEASMLDLALATKLVEAVPLSARLILLGDKDQLAAVESGAVFSELSADPTLSQACVQRLASITGIPAERIVCAEPVKPTRLHDCVVWLTENFRFAKDSSIGRFATQVNFGKADTAIELLRASAESSLEWIDDSNPVLEPASRSRIFDGLKHYLDTARADLGNKAAMFDALGHFRVLCAERESLRGVIEINKFISSHFRGSLDHPLDLDRRSEWYPGRPVMVLRNDYVLKLFNGDVGIVLPDASDALMVFFPESDGGFRAVSPLRLPERETAFATTVHKAQGSEFDRVMLLLPSKPNRAVTRELLYTAVTRARTGVAIIGNEEVLKAAVDSPTRRHSGLISRLGT